MSFVTVKRLLKRFGQQTVFEEINFTIQQGEFITLLGPSGCGKSTLLRSMAGLYPLDSGEVWLDNKNITVLKPQQRDIGMVFQSYALFPNLTVQENIAFGLKMKKLPNSKIQRQVAEIIELVELGGKERVYPQQLSGGQKQRVALARALVVKPQLLLLDEPLSALDAPIRKNLRQQIKSIQKALNLTTLFVTHDQEEAMTLSDRIFLMNKGKIVQQGSAEHIYTQPNNEFVASFMGNYNLLSAPQASQLLGLNIQGMLAIMQAYLHFAMAAISHLSCAEVDRLAELCVQEQILPRLYPQAKKLLASLQAQQIDTLMISATVSFLVEKVAKKLAFSDAMGIDLVIQNGCYSAQISGTATYRSGKVKRLKQWLAEQPATFSPINFYTDSINDLPLCLHVDNPTLVNPRAQLKKQAQQFQWPILCWF